MEGLVTCVDRWESVRGTERAQGCENLRVLGGSVERITSTGNKLIREVRDLEKKARARRENGLFIAEGERLCSEIPATYIERIFVADDYDGCLPEFTGGAAQTRSERRSSEQNYTSVPHDVQNAQARAEAGATAAQASSHPLPSPDTSEQRNRASQRAPKIFQVPRELMEHMSDTKNSQGILAVVRQKKYTELPGDFFLILDTLQDPGNMGTIFRTAEAAGVDGILMNRDCVDVYSPKVVRATMGAMFRMPFMVSDDLPAEIQRMKSEGVQVYAAHLRGTKNHWDFDYRQPTAFMIGNEGNGLQDAIADLADTYLRIPMMGHTESLNAGVAASVLMYEVLRQRS